MRQLFPAVAFCWRSSRATRASRTSDDLTMPEVPTHCWAAAAVAVGASVVATQLHSDSKVPAHCIGASMLGSATVASALVHHGSLMRAPAWYCVVGGVAGASAIGYSLTARLQ